MAAGLAPHPEVEFTLGADYTDNLSGSLYQAIFPTGSGQSSQGASEQARLPKLPVQEAPPPVGLPSTELNVASHAWNFLLNTNYAFAPNLRATGRGRAQAADLFGSQLWIDTLYGGGLFYTRQIMGGYMGSPA